MRKFRPQMDHDTAERLLAGRVAPVDAPPAFAAVAGLLRQAGSEFVSVTPDDALVTSMAASTVAPVQGSPGRKPMLVKLLSAKALAAAAVVTLTATGAAAATDSLPDGAQSGLAKAAEHIGLNLPDPADDRARAATAKEKKAHDADTTDTDTDDATENHGDDVSDAAHDKEVEGDNHGDDVSDVARDNHGHDGTHGRSADATDHHDATDGPDDVDPDDDADADGHDRPDVNGDAWDDTDEDRSDHSGSGRGRP